METDSSSDYMMLHSHICPVKIGHYILFHFVTITNEMITLCMYNSLWHRRLDVWKAGSQSFCISKITGLCKVIAFQNGSTNLLCHLTHTKLFSFPCINIWQYQTLCQMLVVVNLMDVSNAYSPVFVTDIPLVHLQNFFVL